MANRMLERAAHTRPPMTRQGALERLFSLMFKGFVYNQIWEDPDVDLAALALEPHHRLITIASAGCNVLNYLEAGPHQIIAIDLNENHVALTRLKLAALRFLPDHESFFRFFGIAKGKANGKAFDRHLSNRLDELTRRYWNKHIPFHGRRINMFNRDLYRYSLLGRFISVLHMVARLHGKTLDGIVSAQNVQEQRAFFERRIAPLFNSRPVRMMARFPVSLYALGIPPNQYRELVAAAEGHPANLLRERVERLACGFPIRENYFAWQAFARRYDVTERQAVPAYLRRETYDIIRERTARVEVHHASLAEFLKTLPARSLHRYVLLDAQDWMNEQQLCALWTEINRTADSQDARVIFRTAGKRSPLPQKLAPELLNAWRYLESESRAFHARDRSSIYGGFHVYIRPAQP